MATVDTSVNELIINKLTQAQYDAIPEAERSDTELYFITDADSSGNNEIKWAHSWDKPEGITNGGNVCPFFEFDALPDGEYEFYFQLSDKYNLVLSKGDRSNQKFKVNFALCTDSSDTQYVSGNVCLILDGDFGYYYNNKTLNALSNQMISFISSPDYTKYGLDVGGNLFANIPWGISEVIRDVIVCSDIVEINTKETYKVTIYADINNTIRPNWVSNNTSLGGLSTGHIISDPPRDVNHCIINATGMHNYFAIYNVMDNFKNICQQLSISIYVKQTCDVSEVILIGDPLSSYKVIKKCGTGILKNIEIGYHTHDSMSIYVKLNTPNQIYDYEITCSRSGVNSSIMPYDVVANVFSDTFPEEDFVVFPEVFVGATIVPQNINKIVQYTDETNDAYINGYFYKAIGDIINVPENTVLTKNPESEFEISLADDKDVISILSSLMGWLIEDVIENLKYSQFMYLYGAGNPYIWWNYYGDIYDQELLSCFNVIPEEEVPEGYPSSVEFTLQYTPASQKIENSKWEQVNVQPASEGDKLPDQTDNSGKFLMTDGENASWSGTAVVDRATTNSNTSIVINKTGDSGTKPAKECVTLGVTAYTASDSDHSVAIGYNASTNHSRCVSINGIATYRNSVAVNGTTWGLGSIAINGYADSARSTALGYRTKTTASHAIQLGASTTDDYVINPDANTFKVANANGNFEMMDADGNVPLERLTYVIDQIGDISTALTTILGE